MVCYHYGHYGYTMDSCMEKINSSNEKIAGAISNSRDMVLDDKEGSTTIVEGTTNMGEEDVINGNLNGEQPARNMEHIVQAQNREDKGPKDRP